MNSHLLHFALQVNHTTNENVTLPDPHPMHHPSQLAVWREFYSSLNLKVAEKAPIRHTSVFGEILIILSLDWTGSHRNGKIGCPYF